MDEWQIAIVSVVVGSTLTFAFTEATRLIKQRQRLGTHWAAMRAEITICEELARGFLKGNVQSPLYRFPTLAYSTSFPVLLQDGAVSESEVMAIGRFFSQVEQINRGFEYAAQAAFDPEQINLYPQYSRNLLKAWKLVDPSKRDEIPDPTRSQLESTERDYQDHNSALFREAKRIVDEKLGVSC